MSRLLKGTIRLPLFLGIALTISSLAGSASGQATLTGASAKVLKSDINRNSSAEGQTHLGDLTADTRNFSDNLPASLAVGEELAKPSSGSTKISEIPDGATVAAPLRPNVELQNSVMPAGAQPPGTDLVFTVAFTNSGGQAAQVFTVVDPISAETDFKLDSPTTVLGTTGMSVVVEYSNDEKITWTYTPVSGGGGAPEGYDRSVTHVRWRFNGSLGNTFPDNGGHVAVTARIR